MACLWSINERLAGRAGVDIEEPSNAWMQDFIPHDDEDEEIEKDYAMPPITDMSGF